MTGPSRGGPVPLWVCAHACDHSVPAGDASPIRCGGLLASWVCSGLCLWHLTDNSSAYAQCGCVLVCRLWCVFVHGEGLYTVRRVCACSVCGMCGLYVTGVVCVRGTCGLYGERGCAQGWECHVWPHTAQAAPPEGPLPGCGPHFPRCRPGLAVGLDPQGYGNPDFCWLSLRDTLIWSFAGPIGTVIIVSPGLLQSPRFSGMWEAGCVGRKGFGGWRGPWLLRVVCWAGRADLMLLRPRA